MCRSSLEQFKCHTRYAVHKFYSPTNRLLDFLACNTPFTLLSPTTFYPYCYQINQQASLVSQMNAIQDCSDKSSQLVWFQSNDELQQQLIPALFARGLARGMCSS